MVLSYQYGDDEVTVNEQVKSVAALVHREGLTKRGVISEDGSALLDYLEATPGEKGGVTVWGLSGGPVVVHSVREYKDLVARKKSATTFYPYLWVPLAPGAKALPLMVVCNDNSKEEFNVPIMARRWKLLWRLLTKHDLVPVAHYGDGDPRFRAAVMWLGLRGKKGLAIDNPLVKLRLREVEYEGSDGVTHSLMVGGGVDPLHIDWRVLRQYLDVKRVLCPGGLLASPAHLLRFQKEQRG